MIVVIITVVAMIIFLLSGMWIGAATGLASLIGLPPAIGLYETLKMAAFQAFLWMTSYTLSALPLFILMGEILIRAGIVERLYSAFAAVTGKWLPGGLLHPVIVTNAVFGAACGSVTASTALFRETGTGS